MIRVTEQDLVTAAVVGCCVLMVAVEIDIVRTNRELRAAADDTRRANAYMVRQTMKQYEKRRPWQRNKA